MRGGRREGGCHYRPHLEADLDDGDGVEQREGAQRVNVHQERHEGHHHLPVPRILEHRRGARLPPLLQLHRLVGGADVSIRGVAILATYECEAFQLLCTISRRLRPQVARVAGGRGRGADLDFVHKGLDLDLQGAEEAAHLPLVLHVEH